jgi:hypothetical protein
MWALRPINQEHHAGQINRAIRSNWANVMDNPVEGDLVLYLVCETQGYTRRSAAGGITALLEDGVDGAFAIKRVHVGGVVS